MEGDLKAHLKGKEKGMEMLVFLSSSFHLLVNVCQTVKLCKLTLSAVIHFQKFDHLSSDKV